jgi:Predicted membrane-associated Zn-dependent proteases 1
MMQFFYHLLAFLFALGILITFHEFGHFWVAKKCGVRILRFSIGFGRPLWMRCIGADKTEFVIAALPLGGT